jgi:Chaperone of endosialidase
MCCPGGSDAPNPPDPFKTAQAQQNAYINSAIANAYLNRINETTPFGSVRYQEIPDDPAGAAPTSSLPSGINSREDLAAWINSGRGPINSGGPARAPFGVPRMERIVSLNPEEQKILNQRRRIQQNLLKRINHQTPFSLKGAPAAGLELLREAKDLARRPGPSLADYKELANRPGPDLSAYRELANRSGPKLNEAARQQVQDALYRRQTAELDPRYQQQQTDLETQLANQGVMRGSEAWTKAMDDFSRNKDRAYGDALDRAITGGGEEQQRLFNMKLTKREQNLGALKDLFGMQTTRRQQNLGAFKDLYSMQADKRANQLAAYGNLFGLSQQGRNNWLKERLAKRGLPFQELNSLLGKDGVNVPQFSPTQPVNVGTPDISSLIQGNYNKQLELWNQGKQDDQQMMSDIISAAALFAMSSREFKTDPAPITEVLPRLRELKVESWHYKPSFNDSARHIGPYAEDFKELFGVGDGKTIHVVDAMGVCLKAIQELSAKVAQLEEKLAENLHA